jgi:hypothetical protein
MGTVWGVVPDSCKTRVIFVRDCGDVVKTSLAFELKTISHTRFVIARTSRVMTAESYIVGNFRNFQQAL